MELNGLTRDNLFKRPKKTTNCPTVIQNKTSLICLSETGCLCENSNDLYPHYPFHVYESVISDHRQVLIQATVRRHRKNTFTEQNSSNHVTIQDLRNLFIFVE